MRAKRFISVILSILIVCSSFAGMTVFADEANKNERTKDVASVGAEVSDKYSVASPDEAVQDRSGTTGDCTWTYEASTQTLTISGNGEMEGYSEYWYSPWYDFNYDIKNVVIENGVKSIGECVFYNCKNLTGVTIGGSVTSIGEYAFSGCTSLTGVTIPDSVTSIGYSAFKDCTSLTNVTIPNSVTSIGYSAFRSCTSLSKIEVDENNQIYSSLNGDLYNKSQTELIQYSVGKKDKSFIIPSSVTTIGDSAFVGCTSLIGVTIPNSVTSIGEYAFYGCTSLTSVTIPDSVTSIDGGAFSNCTSLISVTIPDSVTSIESYAFKNCTSLNSVIIPDSVTNIGSASFENCIGLIEITIPDSVISIGNDAFVNCKNLTNVIIHNGVTSIGDRAFSSCKSLTDISIPESVTSIKNWPFYGCTSLRKIEVDDNNQNYSSLNGDLYDKTQTELIQYAIGKTDNSFIIPKGITNIRDRAFSCCESLDSVTISTGVTKIGNNVFEDCKRLISVIIPGGVTSIGRSAFSNCNSLNNVTIPDSVTSIGSNAFQGCTSLTSVTIPDSVTSIGSYAFGYYVDYFERFKMKNFTISGYKDTFAEEYAFANGFKFVSLGTPKNKQSIIGFESEYELSIIDKPFNLNAKAETALSYASDNTSVAEVSANGTVTIKGAGTATITITAEETTNYKSATATVEVTVGKISQKVTGFEPKYEVTLGDNPFSLNAKAETALSYASDNTSVAEVSADGTVTIKGAGKATITITAEETDNYKSATATVEITVNKVGQEISVDKQDYKLTNGAKPFSLNAKAETALSYASDNTSVAEVSADGTVTIKGAGKATITITAEETTNYNSATATVEITVGKASQEVTGFEPKYEVTFGDKPFSLNAKAETALSYASDNTSVAEVSTDGTVTIKGAGKATITITAEETANYNSATATVEIIVNRVGQEVSVDKENYKLTYGAKPFKINAKAETALTYVSSNPKVAYVSADGTVTIKGAGTATITITADETENYNSATATVKITVTKATQRLTGVKTQYVTSAGKSFILKPKAKTKLTYTSSNKNVAVVSSTGKVTVKAGGYAYITVKASENGNYKSATVKTKIISAPRDFTSKDVSKVKKTGKTTAKITWKSLAGATGYTVQLATNKTFKGAKTVKNSKNSATLTGLKKGKTYYVRINAYTKVSGKNYSNKWYTVKFKM